MKWYLWKTVFHPPVDKLDIHFILPVGACLWVKENNIQLNEKRMQSSLNCRQSVINNFFFPLSLPGAPSPAGHLGAAGIRREAGQHGYPRPRGRAQHHALWVPLPRGVQDAKAAYSHTAWVAGRLQQDYPLSCVSGLWARGDVVAVWMQRLCLMVSAGFVPLIERFVYLSPGFCGAVSYYCRCDVSPTGSEWSKPDLCLVLSNLFKMWSITVSVYESFQIEKPSMSLFNSTIVTYLINNGTITNIGLETQHPYWATDERKSRFEFYLELEVSSRCWCCIDVKVASKATLYMK